MIAMLAFSSQYSVIVITRYFFNQHFAGPGKKIDFTRYSSARICIDNRNALMSEILRDELYC